MTEEKFTKKEIVQLINENNKYRIDEDYIGYVCNICLTMSYDNGITPYCCDNCLTEDSNKNNPTWKEAKNMQQTILRKRREEYEQKMREQKKVELQTKKLNQYIESLNPLPHSNYGDKYEHLGNYEHKPVG